MRKYINVDNKAGLRLAALETADISVCREAGSFLQSRFWGEFKARFGWKCFAFSALWEAAGAEYRLPLLVLYRRLAPLSGFVYVPWGPELPQPFAGLSAENAAGYSAALAGLASRLRSFLPRDTFCIRFDLPWAGEDPAIVEFRDTRCFGRSLSPVSVTVQPPDTVIVDLSAAESEILSRMKTKWRYNIGLAEKKGVAVRSYAAADAGGSLNSFYTLYRETAARDGIAIHGVEYYRALFQAAAETGEADIRLYLASHEGEDIAGIITLFRKDESVYLYGASANHKRNLMAPYALQWKAMRDAKIAGCLFYDLYGIPPRSAEEDPGHPMAGLYRFKTGFGGRVVHRPGCHDYACRPVFAALYSAAEAARKKFRDLRKRRGR